MSDRRAMHDEHDESERLLEAYLDGALEGAELEAFEQRLSSDADLAAELELQRRLDDQLRQHWAVPEGPG